MSVKDIDEEGMNEGNVGKQMEDDDYSMKFLVRCVTLEGEFEFHLVDLQKKDLCLRYFPSLNNCAGRGDMLMVEGNLFILGDIISKHPADLINNDDNNKHTHKGASCFSIGLNTWKPIDLPLNGNIFNPAAVDGNIFCFGFPLLRPEIFIDGSWNNLSLPSHLQDCQVSLPVVPDHANSRFLVHLLDSNEIYAFYPPNDDHQHGDWQPLYLYSDFWSNAVAVVDGILFLHEWNFPNLLCAYDLNANTCLDVVADLSRVNITMRIFYSMFTLPAKGLICLASRYSPMDKSSPTVHFLSLKVERMGPSVLKLTALDYQSYPIPISSHDFLML